LRRITLALVLHNHQPYGNFGAVLERANAQAYLPLLESLGRHPGVRIGLHYSGTLLDWLESHRPETIDRLGALVRRGQVELLTGGYHEPILPIVPAPDRTGQIAALSARLGGLFGVAPTGAWLAERVWEPTLPTALAGAGVEYTLVDDTHLLLAGLGPEALLGDYVTEDLGATVRVLASLKALRYAIPWSPVDEVVGWLRDEADASDPLAVMGDDGEKLGLWPGTHAHVWQGGWWDRFCEALEAEADWLTTAPPGEALARRAPLGRVYLPSASYDEMGEWALPAPAAEGLYEARAAAEGRDDGSRTFLQGGTWRGFLARYPEANDLHKKMLWVAAKVHRLPAGAAADEARRWLWAGQSNCPYWHGVFGGLYLVHLRTSNWAALIEAELAAEAAGAVDAQTPRASVVDWNADGRPEVVVETADQALVVVPHSGGTLAVWDWRAGRRNLVQGLARRREAYHRRLEDAAAAGRVVLVGDDPAEASSVPDEVAAGDEGAANDGPPASIHTDEVRARELGLERLLFVDPAPRYGFTDRWLPPGADLDALASGAPCDAGGLLGAAWTRHDSAPPLAGGPVAVELAWAGPALGPIAAASKRIRVEAAGAAFEVTYALSAPADRGLDGRLAVETTWAVAGGDAADAWLEVGDERRSLSARAAWPAAAAYRLAVPAAGLRLACTVDVPAEWWQYPVEAVASSDAGFERSYQGTAIVAVWPVRAAAGETWRARMRLRVP